jgi:CxxC motif-containing protein (DUF1111 family)
MPGILPAALTTALVLFAVACTDAPTPAAPIDASRTQRAEAAISSGTLDQPLSGLTQAELSRFNQGRAVFERFFDESAGLGPLFNEASCAECHEDPVVGGTGDEVERHVANYDGNACDDLGPTGGAVVQQRTTSLLLTYSGYGEEPLPPSYTVIAQRSTPQVFGRGLIEAVSDAEILSRVDVNDANNDGVSGRAHIVSGGRIGRFGRKATDATLLEFNAGAFNNEMGLTSPVAPTEQQLVGWPYDNVVDPAPDPELSASDLSLANDFVRFLRVPPQAAGGQAASDGKQLFTNIGCATCHVPSLNTGTSSVKALSNTKVAAFTDLLLHDMGPGLADICRGDALPSEFRTEPLMGLRFREFFLHDGRSQTLEDAVLQHGGEATGARTRYAGLKPGQRSAVIAYLSTL